MPNNTVHTQHLRSYGSAGLEHPDIGEVSGCPSLYRSKYVDHDVVEVGGFALSYGSMIHDAFYLAEQLNVPLLPDALEMAWARTEGVLDVSAMQEAKDDLLRYLDRGDDGLMTIAVEQHLKMPLMEYRGEEWFAGGTLDKIELDPTNERRLIGRDYKTDRRPPGQRQVDEDEQFTMYMLLLRANADRYLPGIDPQDIELVFIGDYVKWYQLYTTRTEEALESYQDWLRAMVRKIVDDEVGAPLLNERCSWCPKKFDCTAFRKLPGDGVTIGDRMSKTTDLSQRVYFMQQAQLTVRGLNAAIKEVQAELKDQARPEGEEGLVFNGVRYSVGTAMEKELDIVRIHEVLGDQLFYGGAKITLGYLEEVWMRHPELKAPLQACIQQVPQGDKLSSKKAT